MAYVNPEYQKPLAELAKRLKPQTILEIGYGYGQSSTVWLKETKADITSVDIDQKDYPKNERLTFIKGSSHVTLPKLAGPFDLIYIDGSHAYEDVKQDIINCQRLGSLILLDDYGVGGGEYGGPDGVYGVKQATKELLNDWQHTHKDIKFANGARVYVKA